ncbi:MAG: helix-hairpin-helix domain-containing protein [Bacteroidota bacterium]
MLFPKKIFYLLVICFLISFIFSISLFAQDTLETFLEQKLENIAESSQNEENDYTNLIESLHYYIKHPINLNHTTKNELQEFGLLNDIQIENLLKHIEKNGKLISLYELQTIDGFDEQTIEKILPYIRVAELTDQLHITLKEILRYGNHQFILRGQQVIEEQKGFSYIDSAGISSNPNSRYIGRPQKIYSRYRFNYENNISFGITAEKDAGELFFKKNLKYNYHDYDSLVRGKLKNGFDFYSAHFYLKNIRFVKALALGDYQIGFGQGLTIWSGMMYGKTSDAVNIKRNAQGIRPYTSVNENLFMRGVAATLGNNVLQFTGFYSQKKVDANITQTDSLNADEVITVSSLQETGLHTTPSELANKNVVTKKVFGGNVSFQKRKYSFGVTGMHTMLSAELNRSLSTYNQFEFMGKELTNIGTDYSFLLRNFNFFGEVSVSDNGGLAYLNGCIVALDSKLSLSVLHRNFQYNYQSLSSNTFAESSANEQGFYLGITAKPVRFITINTYYDNFIFPWLKYQINAPSYGSEFLVQINYTPSKKFDTYLRVKQKDKFVNSNSNDEIDFIVPFKQINYRWNIGYQIFPSVKLRNRVEYIVLNNGSKPKENGYMIYQDLIYKKMGSKISFTFRYSLFDTKSYDSRIYAYENDIFGSYSIPSYYHKGIRSYVMMNWDVTRRMEFWLRWSQFYYSNQSVINAGSLSEIQGHTKSEVKMQMRIKF